MSTLEAAEISVQATPTNLVATWFENGVKTGIELNYLYSLQHRHFYDGGECHHAFTEVSLWECLRQLGIEHFEDPWVEMGRLFAAGRAIEVDAWIEKHCATLGAFYK